MNLWRDRGVSVLHRRTSLGGHRLQTSGLAAGGRCELELVDVVEEALPLAGAALRCLGNHLAGRGRHVAGDVVGVHGEGADLVAELVHGDSARGAPEVLRVVDPTGAPAPEILATTVGVWRAHALAREGRVEEALVQLHALAHDFPGDPRGRGRRVRGWRYNTENHATYAALCGLASRERRRREFMRSALERSEEYERHLLGDTGAELATLSAADLRARARRVFRECAERSREASIGRGLLSTLSPIFVPRTGALGRVASRPMSTIPAFVRSYLPAHALRGRDVSALVGEVVWVHAVDPAVLVELTSEVRDLFEYGNEETTLAERTIPYQTGDRIVSLLLADIGRCLAAGLSPDELRVWYGVQHDPSRRRALALRLRRFADREADAVLSAASGEDGSGIYPEPQSQVRSSSAC